MSISRAKCPRDVHMDISPLTGAVVDLDETGQAMPGRCSAASGCLLHLAGLSATCVAGGSYGNLGGQPAPLAIVPGLPGPEPFPQLRQPVTKGVRLRTSAVALEDPLPSDRR